MAGFATDTSFAHYTVRFGGNEVVVTVENDGVNGPEATAVANGQPVTVETETTVLVDGIDTDEENDLLDEYAEVNGLPRDRVFIDEDGEPGFLAWPLESEES